jgi:hypothetical protein
MVLLVASINYQLNLGYLLTFLLAGSAVVGMHVCHGTLRGLTMQLVPPDAQFMGNSATFGITLVNAPEVARATASAWPCWTPRTRTTGPGPTCPPRAAAPCRWPSRHERRACNACRR